MIKYSIIIFIILSTNIYNYTFSQERSIDIREVLANGQRLSSVSAIAQDSKGFIWFATIDGLVRYDGFNFKTYKHNKNNKNSISNNIARSLSIDGDIIWVGTQGGGLNKLDTKTGKFKAYTVSKTKKNSIISNDIWILHDDSIGNLWIGTWDGGLDKFNKKTQQFTHFKEAKSSSNEETENEIREIYEEDNRTFLLGTQGGGMLILNPETKNIIKFKPNKKDSNSISDDKIYSIFKSKKNEIWVGSLNGELQKFDKNTKLFKKFKNNSKIKKGIFDIKNFSNGEIAIATDHGLFITSEDENSILTINKHNFPSFKNNNIKAVFLDKDSNLWIGTEGGAYKLKINKAFSFLKHEANKDNSISGNYIRSIYEDTDSILWIGTLGNGLNRFDLKTRKNIRIPFDDKNFHQLSSEITDMFEDSYANFWITTWNNGLYLFDKSKMKVLKHYTQFAPFNTLSDNRVQSILEEKPGILWISTENGLNRFDYTKNKWECFKFNYNKVNTLSGNKFQSKALIKDQNGAIWAGTWANGLNVLIPSTNSTNKYKIHYWENNYQDTSSIISNSIISLLNDSNGNLWIGTFGSGVAFVSAKQINNIKNNKNLKFKNYSTQEGLVNNVVYGIEEDNLGNIWFSTEKGLSCFSPKNKKFKNFTIENGLTNDKYYWGASSKSDKNLYFGGINGLDIVNPTKLNNKKIKNYLEITDIYFFKKKMQKQFEKIIKNKSISEIKNIQIKKEMAFFTIKYIALNFQNNYQVKYSYKLEGLDNEWIINDNNKYVTFSNLPSGIFKFKIRTKISGQDWSDAKTLLTIEVMPHWSETLGFRAFFSISIIVFIALFFYFRFKIIKNKNIEIEKKFEERTEELHKKNIELELSNSKLEFQKEKAEQQSIKTDRINKELNDFAYIISHDLKAPLRGISQLASWIYMDYKDSFDTNGKIQLNLLIDRVKTMDKMIDGVLQYSRATNFIGDFEEINTNEIIQEVVDLIEIPSGFEIQIEDKMPIIKGERVRIMQVFQNLINNAIKYMNKPNGFIKITYSDLDSHWQFNIIDNGPGIDKKHHSSIFNIFKTVNETKTKDSSGIGLSIVKKIIQIYKGKIWVESELGKGATFSFTISKEIG